MTASGSRGLSGGVDLDFVLAHAQRALASYDPEEKIRRDFAHASRLHVETLHHVELQVIIEIDHARRRQWVAVRGTDNFANLLHDMIVMKDEDTPLGIPLDAGFEECGDAVRAFAEPLLEPGLPIHVTGHSLGGAAALVLALYLHVHDVHELASCVTFGQPKITNDRGAALVSEVPLLRVVHDDDPVPRVPPGSLLTPVHGVYRQCGPEIRIDDDGFVIVDEAEVHATGGDAFWANLLHQHLDDHHMEGYFAHIQRLLRASVR